jgi:hypothetical protein
MNNSKTTSVQDAPSEGGARAKHTDAHAQSEGTSPPRPTRSDITLGYNPGLWRIPDWGVHEPGDVPPWLEPDYHQLPDWFLPERPEVQAVLPDLQLMQLLMRIPALRLNPREVRTDPPGIEDLIALAEESGLPRAAGSGEYRPTMETIHVPIANELPSECFGAGLGKLGYGFRAVARIVSHPSGSSELDAFEQSIRGREPDSSEWDAPGEKERLYSLWHLELLKHLFYVGTPPVYAPRTEPIAQDDARLAVDILQLVVYGVTSRRQDFENLLQQVKDKHAYHQQKAAS